SSGAPSLLVMTSTNGAPALTLISSGLKRFFSMVRGISCGASAATTFGAPLATSAIIPATIASIARRVIALASAPRDALGSPRVYSTVTLIIFRCRALSGAAPASGYRHAPGRSGPSGHASLLPMTRVPDGLLWPAADRAGRYRKGGGFRKTM